MARYDKAYCADHYHSTRYSVCFGNDLHLCTDVYKRQDRKSQGNQEKIL